MELRHSSNTCSQTELCRVYVSEEEDFEAALKAQIAQAKRDGRKSIVANLRTQQHKEYGAQMKRAGFQNVGNYYGNSNDTVYVWIYGLRKAPARVMTKAARAVKRAIAR
jgi:hypothetical protein